MTIITNQNASEHTANHFVAEASSLGLAPGQWPSILKTTLGNSRPLVFTGHRYEDGDLISGTYKQETGCIRLEILND